MGILQLWQTARKPNPSWHPLPTSMYHGFPKRLQQWPCLLKPLSTCDRWSDGMNVLDMFGWMSLRSYEGFVMKAGFCTVYSSWSYVIFGENGNSVYFWKRILGPLNLQCRSRGRHCFWLLTWVDSVAVWHPHLQGCFGSQGDKMRYLDTVYWLHKTLGWTSTGPPNFFCSSCTCAWAVSTFRWVALVHPGTLALVELDLPKTRQLHKHSVYSNSKKPSPTYNLLIPDTYRSQHMTMIFHIVYVMSFFKLVKNHPHSQSQPTLRIFASIMASSKFCLSVKHGNVVGLNSSHRIWSRWWIQPIWKNILVKSDHSSFLHGLGWK